MELSGISYKAGLLVRAGGLEAAHRMIELDVDGPFVRKLGLYLLRRLGLARLRLGWIVFKAFSALKRKIIF